MVGEESMSQCGDERQTARQAECSARAYSPAVNRERVGNCSRDGAKSTISKRAETEAEDSAWSCH